LRKLCESGEVASLFLLEKQEEELRKIKHSKPTPAFVMDAWHMINYPAIRMPAVTTEPYLP
jgi:hypothetical protein